MTVEQLAHSQLLTLEQVIERTTRESVDAHNDPYVFPKPIKRAAVIGAGPAGLTAAKALKEHGIQVKVFERASDVGGTWLYQKTPTRKISAPGLENGHTNGHHKQQHEAQQEVETATAAEAQQVVDEHAPPNGCYYALFNNTPVPMINYEDFPYPPDTPWYIPHTRLQKHLHDYATTFGLYDITEFNTSVEHVEREETDAEGSQWTITARRCERVSDCKVRFTTFRETFDAVAVATGVFQKPNMPRMEKLAEYDQQWPERVKHAKQFRHCSEFAGKNVLLIGANVSAVDLTQRLEGVANNVYLSVRGDFDDKTSGILALIRSGTPASTIRKPGIQCFADKDGSVNGAITFVDGTVIPDIDCVVFCTGYVLDYGFLGSLRAHEDDPADVKDRAIVHVNNTRPISTYRELFAMKDPTLAFVGVARHQHGLGHFWYQGQAVARVWSGNAVIPSQKAMRDFMDSYELPFAPYDMSTLSEQLHIQRIVTWLNTHADLQNKSLKPLKGLDNAVAGIWDEVKRTWIKRTQEVVAKAKETPPHGML